MKNLKLFLTLIMALSFIALAFFENKGIKIISSIVAIFAATTFIYLQTKEKGIK